MAWAYPTNVTSSLDLLTWTDTTVSGWFGAGVLMAFWMVMFLVTKKTDTKKAFATTSFMTALIAVPMRVLELINDTHVIIAIVMAAAGLLWLIWDKN